jgi:hypothetical protein
VIGIVSGKSPNEGWRVDIGAAHQANLDGLAFEGATKRSRPVFKVNLNLSFLVYNKNLKLIGLTDKCIGICSCFASTQRYGA